MKKIHKLFESIDKNIVDILPIKEQDKKIYNRRLRKLKRDPSGFVEDSLKKRIPQMRKILPISYVSLNQYVVVSAVYNVEKYLDDYFKSLVNQTISFKKNITVILVDDGSTDKSNDVIEKWQNKYPKNIIYLRKPNGGASSARNYGLSYLKENFNSKFNYVSFIDPDDFVSFEYFAEVDKFVGNNRNCKIVSCNMNYFYEKSNIIRDNHPLNFRYKKSKTVDAVSLGSNIILSAATTVYDIRMIQDLGII